MSIPMEAIEDILSRLPVESLLRFRCVCPPWRDLIDSPYFVKLHLNRSIETETNLNLIFLSNQNGKPSLLAAKFEPSILSLEAKELDHHPLQDTKYGIPQVWGSSNGLICLGSNFCKGIITLSNDSHPTIVLWNPSTRRSVTLPYTAFDFKKEEAEGPISHYRRTCGYGFAYDSVGDDYKVIMHMETIRRGNMAMVYSKKVYSLKEHSWHSVKESYNNLPYMKSEPGQSSSNVTHWIMTPDLDKTGEIVAFDLHSETSQIVPGPRLEDTQCSLSLEPFQGSICVVCMNRLSIVGVWVMREYGVQESWTKLLSLKPNMTRPFYVQKKSEGVFIQHDGKLLCIDTGDRKTCYDMENEARDGKVKNIEVFGLKSFEKVDTYIGSLVPLGRFSKLNDDKKSKKKNKNEMAGFLSKGFKLKL